MADNLKLIIPLLRLVHNQNLTEAHLRVALEGRFPAKKWKSNYIIETMINKTIIRLAAIKPANRMLGIPVLEIFCLRCCCCYETECGF
jgi:hypothetical protein